MLDQLVESRSNLQNQKTRGGYLFTTAFLVFSLFASGILWSLFAKNLDIGSDGLELSSIIQPVPIPVDEPPAPEPVQPERQVSAPRQNETNIYVRRENVASTNEPIPPKSVSTSRNDQVSRPNAAYRIGDINSNPSGPVGAVRDGTGSNNPGATIAAAKPNRIEDNGKEEPPPTAKKPVPTVEKKQNKPPVSIGVINGRAISLPKPAYPTPAKVVGASGDVNVQVTIDENGVVISAKAVSGHPLLRQAAENAARNAKFSPTLLSNVPVKVTGVIVYKFTR